MSVRALQHLFSSVERGRFPNYGRGFQTVAVSEELAGTEDLAVLEEVSFYSVSRERRARGDLPVMETFLRLPSGRFALGRTLPWGTDALGREGNYLAHHVVVTEADLCLVRGDPFALLDAVPRATPGADLTPRALAPLALAPAPGEPGFSALAALPPPLRAALGAAVIERGDRTLLLVDAAAPAILRALFALLPVEERLRLAFSTHFYEADHLRAHFTVACVGARAEIPSRLDQYWPIDPKGESASGLAPAGAYAKWLTAALHEGDWDEIRAMAAVLDRLRAGPVGCDEIPLPEGGAAGAALWEQVGLRLPAALVGQADRIGAYLSAIPDRRPFAEGLLAAASPSQLPCLDDLRSVASPSAWRAWVKRWASDPAVGPYARDALPWWRRGRR